MAINLNTSTSIVDFLKSSGKPSDFNSRKGLYESSGLAGAFGAFRGTTEQNTTLLRKLQATPQPTTPSVPSGISFNPATNISTIQEPPTPPPTPKEVIDETTPKTTSTITDFLPEEKEATADVLGETVRGQERITRDVGRLKEEAGFEQQTLAAKGAGDITAEGEKFAAAGLFRSGKRERSQAEIALDVATKQSEAKRKLGDDIYNLFSTEEKQLGTEFISKLSIPEAKEFANIPAPIRGIVMKNYQDAITKAQEKASSSAQKTLESLGYAVVGGKIVPTFEREKFAQTEATRAEERDIARQDRLTQQDISNEFRATGLSISASTAATLAELRNITLQNKSVASPGQIVNKTTGLPVDVTDVSAEKVAGYQTLLSATQRVKNLLAKTPSTGAIKGWFVREGVVWPAIQGQLNPQETELMQEMARIANQYVYMVSGKQINEQEYVRLSKTIPSILYTKENNEIILKNFEKYSGDGLSNYLRVNGWKINEGGTTQAPQGGTSQLSDEDAFQEYLRLKGE